MAYTVFVCEAQPVAVEGLYRILDAQPDFTIAGHGADLPGSLSEIGSILPDLIVLGQSNPPRPLLPQVPQLLAASPRSRIILWVVESAEQETFRALHSGARALISKTAPVQTLVECFRTVASGQVWLDSAHEISLGFGDSPSVLRITPREREIIELICRGLKNREIAEILRITPGTVKVHLMHIFEKTGTKDRFQLALKARQHFGIDPCPNIQGIQPIANGI